MINLPHVKLFLDSIKGSIRTPIAKLVTIKGLVVGLFSAYGLLRLTVLRLQLLELCIPDNEYSHLLKHSTQYLLQYQGNGKL